MTTQIGVPTLKEPSMICEIRAVSTEQDSSRYPYIATNNDRIALSEAFEDLKSTRPYSIRGRVFAFRFQHFCIMLCEGIEKMIDDLG